MASDYAKTYTTFGGADIVATFGKKVIGELQGITYSVTREKAPVYTMGSPDPRSFSRGKRGIAGNLVFTVFDRAALEVELGYQSVYGWGAMATSTKGQFSVQDLSDQIENIIGDTAWYDNTSEFGVKARDVSYVDEVPPFDVTITFANEYGQVATMKIFGVEILNEGSGMSVDDVVTERAMTYVARGLEHIRSLTRSTTGAASAPEAFRDVPSSGMIGTGR